VDEFTLPNYEFAGVSEKEKRGGEGGGTRKKGFVKPTKSLVKKRDNIKKLLQQQNVKFYQQNDCLLQQKFCLQQQKIHFLSLILLP